VELQVLLYQNLEVEHRGATDDGGDVATSAGDHQGASPVEGEMGSLKVKMAPENKAEAIRRWDGFKQQIGYEGDEEPMEKSEDDDYPGPIWAIGEEHLPPSRRRSEPAESTMILMKCVEAKRIEQIMMHAEEM
jgi:hypothetical protein